MRRRLRRIGARLGVVAALAAVMVMLAVTFGCGHSIGPGIPFEHSPEFDFTEPRECDPLASHEPQPPPPLPTGHVLLRYLGAGGVYVEWGDRALLSAPFFSNPGILRGGLGRLRWDREAIERGLRHVPMGKVGAILAGHSHYDHIGDLPIVAARAPNARLLVNQSGRNALEPFPELVHRVRLLEEIDSRPTQLSDAAGRALPFRVRPVISRHAPHFDSITIGTGTTEPTGEAWPRRRWGDLKAGWTYAFVIDLTDGTTETSPVRFRLFLQDSGSEAPAGLPPPPAPGDPPYDLAILCVASSQFVKPYPEDVLRRIAPRHVLASHYENFFAPWGPRRGFVPLLTRRVANRFLRRVESTLEDLHVPGTPPLRPPCGPSDARWTMPLTGEWLLFRPSTEASTPTVR